MPDQQDLEVESPDEGPGWMPAILAATVLMGIVGFVVCAFSTWILYQQRSQFAIRTLRGALIPQVEQGRLDPETKSAVIAELEQFAGDLERGQHENWQAAGAMTRLVKIPIHQWGEVQAVEVIIQNNPDADPTDALKQLSRLLRAAELGKANSIDFESVLEPVRVADPDAPTRFSLKQPPDSESIAETVQRAKLVADRAEIPDQRFEKVRLAAIVRREIERGINEGTP